MAAPGATGPADRRWTLGAAEASVAARLAAWASTNTVDRFWRRDPALWPAAPPSDVEGRLGWLRAPEQSAALLEELRAFAEATEADGFEHVVLLGMGGSSLAAEVIARVLPHGRGRPLFSVLDSTHPAAVRSCAERAPVGRTLYVLSSKSGTTLEPNAFFRFFWERAKQGSGEPGRRFVAITDPGTPLQRLASDRGFRACFAAPADVGGRYSALTTFGLVPAALLGVDLPGLLATARAMVARCADPADGASNPGLRLGAALGELARAGRDKVVFFPSASLAPFPAWAEQLLAESLGKLGRGIVPVADAPPPGEFPQGSDGVAVQLALEGERDRALERGLASWEAAGTPVLRFVLSSPLDLGQEFFRWEFAVAACGAVLDVDPFDQPDVERAKELARAAMDPHSPPNAPSGSSPRPVDASLEAPLERWLASARPGDYVAVQAFLAPEGATDAALAGLASCLRRRLGTVVTVGYGPRFLHSTGQLHKGGPPSGLYLQLVDRPVVDLTVPELGVTFGRIVGAQASGDRSALEEMHRRVLAVDVGRTPRVGLATLGRLVEDHEDAARPAR